MRYIYIEINSESENDIIISIEHIIPINKL